MLSSGITDPEEIYNFVKNEFAPSIEAMQLGIKKDVEFQTMQLRALAGSGKLGVNQFAISREVARNTGMLAGQAIEQLGKINATITQSAIDAAIQVQGYNTQLYATAMQGYTAIAQTSMNATLSYIGVTADLYTDQADAIMGIVNNVVQLATAESSAMLNDKQIEYDLQKNADNNATQLEIANIQSEAQKYVADVNSATQMFTNQLSADTNLAITQMETEARNYATDATTSFNEAQLAAGIEEALMLDENADEKLAFEYAQMEAKNTSSPEVKKVAEAALNKIEVESGQDAAKKNTTPSATNEGGI